MMSLKEAETIVLDRIKDGATQVEIFTGIPKKQQPTILLAIKKLIITGQMIFEGGKYVSI